MTTQMPPGAAAAPRRRPYEAPAIEQSGSFERVVLACSQTPQQSQDDPDCLTHNCAPACSS